MVCGPATTQKQFFDNCGIRGLLDSALNGYAATAFAYGQTGSGKTFTISGHQERIENIAADTGGTPFDGLVPRSIRYLFESIARARQGTGDGETTFRYVVQKRRESGKRRSGTRMEAL